MSFSSATGPQLGLRKEALLQFASIDLTEWCQEAKVEHCRAFTGLSTCGRYVKHTLSSCGHASLCEECSQNCEVCPICRTPLRKDGKLRLRLYDKCIEAGIISMKDDLRSECKYPGAHLDVQRLYSLFDVALENNLVSSICHYVTDVCLDENAVSSDPVVAFLLDEVVVKNWCRLKYKSVVQDLHEIYARVDTMKTNLNLLLRFSLMLNGLSSVLTVLESSFAGSLSAELQDLHWLSENTLKAKQHLEVIIWCVKHKFLESIEPHYPKSVSWKLHARERKLAAKERTWPNLSTLESTLFIEDALSNLHIDQDFLGGELDARTLMGDVQPLSDYSEMVGVSGLYPFKDLRSAADILFLHGSSDMAVAKRAIFLYYLFDRHWSMPEAGWRHIVDDFANSFDIKRQSVMESFVFYLLDDHSDEALHQASKILPEITSPDTHPKVAEVLLERQRPDLALMVLRCSGRDGFSSDPNRKHDDGDDDDLHPMPLGVAVTAVRVRIECGLLTEAFIYHRMHCSRVADNKLRAGSSKLDSNDVEVLVTEICSLCIRRNLVDRMIELPWNSDEELFLHKCLFDKACQEPSSIIGSLLVVFYLQRCRYVEAYQVDNKLWSLEHKYFNTASDEEIFKINSISQWREGLINKSIELLPEVQRVELKSRSPIEIGPMGSTDVGISKETLIFSPSPSSLIDTSIKPSVVLHPDHKGESSVISDGSGKYSIYPFNGQLPASNGFTAKNHPHPSADLSNQRPVNSPVTPFEWKLSRSIAPGARFRGENTTSSTEMAAFSFPRGVNHADAVSASARRGQFGSSEQEMKKDAFFRFEEREIPKSMTTNGVPKWRSDDSSEDDNRSEPVMGSRMSSLRGRGRRGRR